MIFGVQSLIGSLILSYFGFHKLDPQVFLLVVFIADLRADQVPNLAIPLFEFLNFFYFARVKTGFLDPIPVIVLVLEF